MGGDIRLESEEGKGTEIIFHLPITTNNRPASLSRLPRSESMTWSIPSRPDNGMERKDIQPITKLALYTRNHQTWQILRDIFTSIGVTVTNESNTNPMDVNTDKATISPVLLEMELFEHMPSLHLKLLGSEKPPCLVLFNEKERGPLFPSVTEAENIILIRRPLALHRLAQCFKEPSKYMGGKTLPKIRTRAPHVAEEEFSKPSLSSQRQELAIKDAATGKTIRWDTSDSVYPISDESSIPRRKRILMVEDNEVNGKMGMKLLAIAGYDAELAEDGEVALTKITESGSNYDVILMDCQVSPLVYRSHV
jgi:hypothetical protein